MKAIVIGAGIIGTLTAYYLARSGIEVTLVDKHDAPGKGASFANGGQLSYTYHEPFGTPALLRQFPTIWKERKHGPVFFSLRPDPALWEWYFRLVQQSAAANATRNAEALLKLHLYSRWKFAEFYNEHRDLRFDLSTRGKLHVFHDRDALDAAAQEARRIHSKDSPQEVLDASGCVAKEPALDHVKHNIAGGIFSPIDVTGDAHAFIEALVAKMDRSFMPVTFKYGTEVTGFSRDKEEIFHLSTSHGDLRADIYVLAGGYESADLLQGVNLHVPITPLKGHSITVPIVEPARVPQASVTVHDKHIVFARLGQRLRVAGLTEFGARNAAPDPAKVNLLLRYLNEFFPAATDSSAPQGWAGMRPALPWSTPIIGGTPYRNLFLNIGHGMFGWTQAHGSAKLLADIICKKPVELDVSGYQGLRK